MKKNTNKLYKTLKHKTHDKYGCIIGDKVITYDLPIILPMEVNMKDLQGLTPADLKDYKLVVVTIIEIKPKIK